MICCGIDRLGQTSESCSLFHQTSARATGAFWRSETATNAPFSDCLRFYSKCLRQPSLSSILILHDQIPFPIGILIHKNLTMDHIQTPRYVRPHHGFATPGPVVLLSAT